MEVPTEQLWANGSGTTFTAQRGNPFLKVIQITTQKQIVVTAKVSQNSECRLHIRNRSDHIQFAIQRTIKFLWFNAADPNPSDLESKFPWKELLVPVVHNEDPDVMLFTSTGRVCSRADIATLLTEIGHQVHHITNVGIDGGAFVASGNGNAVVMLNERRGHSIEQGIVLDVDWY